MKKQMNRKGFTIVELVVVVAVIAVLVAVLIPTFSGIIKKANMSADQSAVYSMNTAIAIAETEVTTLEQAVDALEAQGFEVKNLKPLTKHREFYYYKSLNAVVLVVTDEETGVKSVEFPTEKKYSETFADDLAKTGEAQELFNLYDGAKYIDVVASGRNDFKNAVEAGTKNISLKKDLTMNKTTTVPAGAEIIVDLGGKTLSTAKRDSISHFYAFDVEGTLTFTNGTVDARGVQVYEGGKLIIGEGATLNAVDDNGGACIWLYEGSELVIDGGKFTALNGDCDHVNDAEGKAEPGIINNNGGKVTINGGTFESVSNCYAIINNDGEMVINGGTFKSTRGMLCANDGTITVNGGTFTTASDAVAWLGYVYDGDITVNAGTFTGPNEFTVDSANDANGTITVKAGVVVNGTRVAETQTYNG